MQRQIRNISWIAWSSVLTMASFVVAAAGDELPKFQVPGHERAMERLNELHALHHERAFTRCTLWDGWLPRATLWASRKKQQQYRQAFLERPFEPDGYVSMQQHRGMAHSAGWPFPAWQQSTGQGFHFSTVGDAWAIQNFRLQPLDSVAGWEIEGAEVIEIDPAVGLQLKVTGETVSLVTPAFRCGTIVAPFARLEWSASPPPENGRLKVEWLLEGETQWPQERFVELPIQRNDDTLQYDNVPLYPQPEYRGIVTRYRLTWSGLSQSQLTLKSVITAIDTRHPITNSLFVRGSCDYYLWTGDQAFLTQNLDRMRRALRYAIEEFAVGEQHHVRVPWVGHDGRSGLVFNRQGNKQLRPGLGVGNNYWDLLPFGGHDALATMYLADAIEGMQEVERAIQRSPQGVAQAQSEPFSIKRLDELLEAIRADFQETFWNPDLQRFVGWIDLQGRAYDYGFTFVNLEAVHYGMASPAQADAILEWLDGERLIPGDTSQGLDIYHWRFAPRATTKRNVETYAWVWSQPETIPWGGQVQDGGAVLGFSYHDLMARLKMRGPDAAWQRLQAILAWFDEVQEAGGYRAYYAIPGRGSLQGGGTAGGLGVDKEFLESILVPQIMLDGFLGAEANADGLQLRPRLPADWEAITLDRLYFREHTLAIEANRELVKVEVLAGNPQMLRVSLAADDPRELVIVSAKVKQP